MLVIRNQIVVQKEEEEEGGRELRNQKKTFSLCLRLITAIKKEN